MKLKLIVLTFLIGLNTSSLLSQESAHDLILKGVDAMMEGEYVNSLELLTKARNIADEEGDYKNLFVAINNIGLNYHKLLDTNEALKYYLESYTIAIKELDPSYEMTSINNIAILYSQQKNFDKAIEYFLKAYELADEEKDSLKKGIYAINLAQVYSEKKEYQEASSYISKALKLLENEPDYLLDAIAVDVLVKKDLGHTTEAESAIKELLPKLNENRYSESRVALMLALADIEVKRGNPKIALQLCNKALNQKPINFETRYEIFNQISAISRKTENYPQALVAMDSMMYLKQAIYDLNNGQQYQANRVKFEVLNYENQLTKERQRIKSQKRLILVLAIGAIFIISLLIWALRLNRIRSNQRKDLLQRQEKILSLELDNEKANNLLLEKQLKEKETKLLLEKEKYKNEIETKNRKLSAKALYLIDKNNLIESIISDLEQSKTIKPTKEITDYIRRLKELLKNDEEWGNFIEYFDKVNHGLLTKLKTKHNNLNANDIRFISYLYMNLSMKEIGSIMNVTPEACRKRKERISKKIELSENEDLYNYISKI
ncbi:tetratricopeptide repeat protein [Mangrovimonas aestuarii]|uniref:tetratricopeptide repeat protein n=1 Tax=Mangrovimonas aestuarii TaxID=3018443 RepID=UPI0023793C83|nr:tetratricopeptide repeat protein [Mangrovimonas aestuarii]